MIEKLGSALKKTAKAAKKTGSAAKKAGKTVKDINKARHIARHISKTIRKAIFSLLITVCPLLLIIVICTAIIAGVIGAGSGAKHKTVAGIEEEYNIDEETLRVAYIFEGYVSYSSDPLKNDYLRKYLEIQNNGYETALIELWKSLIKDMYIDNTATTLFSTEEKWEQTLKELNKNNTDYYENNDLLKKHSKVDKDKYKNKVLEKYRYTTSDDYVYDKRILKYYTIKTRKGFDRITKETANFLSDDNYKEENYVYNISKSAEENVKSLFSVVYTDNIIRTCIDAFTDKETGKVIKSVSDYMPEYKKDNPNAFEKLKGKENKSKRVELCRKHQLKKVIRRMEGENGLIEKCVTLKYSNHTADRLTKWLYTQSEEDSTKTYNYKKTEHKFTTDYFKTLTDTLVSAYSSTGSADAICTLAKSKIGQGGQHFWETTKSWTGNGADWCAIFCAWLMENSDIEPSSVGWSAYCPDWVINATNKGIFKKRGSYIPKPGDFVIFQYSDSSSADHVGIVIEVKGDTFTTVEGNTNGSHYTNSVVGSTTYQMTDTDILGFVSMTYKENPNRGSGKGSPKGVNLQPTEIDSKYKGHKVALTAAERQTIEALVYNENGGNGYEGCLLLAQCLRDAIYNKYNGATPSNVKQVMGYAASDTGQASQIAKNAVQYIFDEGGYAVKHRIYFMYAPDICESKWHESQHFIIEHNNGGGRVKFFDAWQ